MFSISGCRATCRRKADSPQKHPGMTVHENLSHKCFMTQPDRHSRGRSREFRKATFTRFPTKSFGNDGPYALVRIYETGSTWSGLEIARCLPSGMINHISNKNANNSGY